MAIEPEDFALLKEARQISPELGACAILGDCNIHVGLDQFKRELNFDVVDTFDVNGDPTYKVDLNEPLAEFLHHKYDWVIDSGTLYCCFDIATALQNILNILKDTGNVVHTSNLSGFYGRGFYSLSPAFFRDFYTCNNFTIEMSATKTRTSRVWNKFNSQYTYLNNKNLSFQESAGEFIPEIPNDSMIFCYASRQKKCSFIKPIPKHFINTDGR